MKKFFCPLQNLLKLVFVLFLTTFFVLNVDAQEIKNIKSVMDHTNLKRKSIGSLGDRFKKLSTERLDK